MKLRFLLLLCTAIFLVHCKKENQNQDEFGFLKATIDGVNFEAATVSANVENGILGVLGWRELNHGFTLLAMNYTGPGTYPLNLSNGLAMFQKGIDSSSLFISDHTNNNGVLNVTSMSNDWVKGNFRFTAIGQGGTKNITDGVFEVKIRR